ncbi:hypothetical protein ACVINW_007916 [Bradyrhizobium sp. USDA 4461]
MCCMNPDLVQHMKCASSNRRLRMAEDRFSGDPVL